MPPESPDGLDIHPNIGPVSRVSKRAAMVIFGIVLALIVLLFWGAEKRRNKREQQEQDRAKSAVIETPSPEGVIQPNPVSPQPLPMRDQPQQPDSPEVQIHMREFPQQEIRPPVKPEPTPAEIAAARTREAMLSPLTIRQEGNQVTAPMAAPVARTRTVAASEAERSESGDEYALANLQKNKKAFISGSQTKPSTNYLGYTRTRQLAPCEIKAGWEIPAVMEQDINSDLPGDIKARISQNVYDTATGKYLLIPQGSLLVGKYSSEVGYGQEAAQAIWDRIIYPDGSSINLDGMVGLDSQGNSGFRDKVDRHYKRTFGMAILTSAFVAAYELTNRRSYGNNMYAQPSASDRAVGSMTGEMSNTAATITRKNINVQPTIKIRAGYRFSVRVNRDMLFSEPYAPDTPQMDDPTPGLQKASR